MIPLSPPLWHLRPYMICVICRRCIIENVDLVFAVLNNADRYLGHTQHFFVPACGPSFDECMIYTKSITYSWRICRVPRCSICSISPDAFLCHLSCMEMVSTHIYGYDKSTAWELIPPIICQYARFSDPWPRARGDYGLSIMPRTATKVPQPESKRLSNILQRSRFVEQIYHLPSELLQMVEAFSKESMFWNLLAALEWPMDFATGEPHTMSLKGLGTWQRGGLLNIGSSASSMVLGIDELGIKETCFSDNYGSGSHMTSMWYIRLEAAQLSTAKVRLKNGRLCLTKRPENLMLWDTSNIPHPTCYYVAGPESQTCRLRTISLKGDVTGLTFFVYNGLTYAVHVHNSKASSAWATYSRLPPKQQEQIVWIFVPLGNLPPERKIERLWLRYRKINNEPRGWSMPCLVIRTGKGRNHTIGLYCGLSQARAEFTYEVLGCNMITELLYSDPDLGEPILGFGACASERYHLNPPRNMPIFPKSQLQDQVYYSHGMLDSVSHARIFYESETNYCRGIVLQHQDGDEEVLGQRRDDLLRKDCIAPFLLSYKQVGNHIQLQFHSTCDKDTVPDGQGYYILCMKGKIRWWFDVQYDYIMTEEVPSSQIKETRSYRGDD